jgi:hypothetical protein
MVANAKRKEARAREFAHRQAKAEAQKEKNDDKQAVKSKQKGTNDDDATKQAGENGSNDRNNKHRFICFIGLSSPTVLSPLFPSSLLPLLSCSNEIETLTTSFKAIYHTLQPQKRFPNTLPA